MTRSEHKRFVRYVLALLVIAVLFGSFTLSAFALTSGFNMSDTYRNSKYGRNISSLFLDGGDITRVLSAALSQVGYHEGNNISEITGLNKSGQGNFTEYNYYYGSLQGYGYGYPWCAAFVSWCMRVAGIPKETVKSHTSCTLWVTWFKENSSYKARGSYTPKAGDVIFFKSANVTRASDHVGLVLYVKNGTVYTVEGNSSGEVGIRSYSLSDTYIVGYGIPGYTSDGKETDFSVKSQGIYIVNTASLNVRTKPSTSSGEIIGSLSEGNMIEVVGFSGSTWGQITYNGKTAWVSLSYTQLVEERPNLTLTLDLGDGEGVKTDHSVMKGKTLSIPNQTPSLKGYIFKGWAETKNGEPKYSPGDSIRLTSSQKLFAIWEKEIYTVSFWGYNGELIEEKHIPYGEQITSPEKIPEKQPTDENTFVFLGWDHELGIATSDDSFVAIFEAVPIISEEEKEEESTESPDVENEVESESDTNDSEEDTSQSLATTEMVSGVVFAAVSGIIALVTIKRRGLECL